MNLKKIKDSLISTDKLSELVSQMNITYQEVYSGEFDVWSGYSGVADINGVEWQLDLEEGDTEPYLYHDGINVDLTPAQKNYLIDYIMANHTVKEPYNSPTEYHNPDYEDEMAEFGHQISDSSISDEELYDVTIEMDLIEEEEVTSGEAFLWSGSSGQITIDGVEWVLALAEGSDEPHLYRDGIEVNLTPTQKHDMLDYIRNNSFNYVEPYDIPNKYQNPDYEDEMAEFKQNLPDIFPFYSEDEIENHLKNISKLFNS